MTKFFKIPAVENSNNIGCLRVETSVQNFVKTLGVEINTYSSLLIPLLIDKLPEDLRLRIATGGALQRCSWEKVFWKYAAKLQGSTHA